MLYHAFCRLAAPALLAGLLLASCGGPAATQTARLPYLGEPEVRAPGDTVYPTVPAFRLHDQDGKLVTNQSLAHKVYITDFFFATCPGICPKMQSELLKVYKQYATNPGVVFVSHTIDPDHDSLPVLRDYARRLGVADNGGHWQFVRASRDTAYALAKAYFTGAMPDKAAPGGIAHSGTFALVDDQGHVRGLYDSLNPNETARLQKELPELLAEVKTRQGQPATAQR
ncbi:SCO family protein [Hymenobacter sp. HMF4947]|uniref:SCO family protein n=1 Tax=Hymenobacter ginkgonis TaxID=2682976 RepID=A0A7K1TG06_9BACT|nr:SCO family protein [Hymenobacter ginkgonis]MVN77333.1 SCO family protein [Hymenobacter ginkgonis]